MSSFNIASLMNLDCFWFHSVIIIAHSWKTQKIPQKIRSCVVVVWLCRLRYTRTAKYKKSSFYWNGLCILDYGFHNGPSLSHEVRSIFKLKVSVDSVAGANWSWEFWCHIFCFDLSSTLVLRHFSHCHTDRPY